MDICLNMSVLAEIYLESFLRNLPRRSVETAYNTNIRIAPVFQIHLQFVRRLGDPFTTDGSDGRVRHVRVHFRF